jgi:NADH:ubiquinone oxidoreductase subunit 3 (subunit A)
MTQIYLLFFFVPLLSLIFLILNFLFSPHKPDEIKNSAYECGFREIMFQTRTKFPIHFYIVAMLFLIFDLEILLVYPLPLILYDINYYGFAIFLLFFLILLVGFIFEIKSGAIKLDKNFIFRNNNNSIKSNKSKNSLNPFIIKNNLVKINFSCSSIKKKNIKNIP